MLCNVINTLLTEENLCATLDDLVGDGLDHPLFFVKECLELVRAGNIDLGINLSLLELDCSVEEHDFSLGDLLWHAGVDTFLVNDHSDDDL